jgi:hypothetical protein
LRLRQSHSYLKVNFIRLVFNQTFHRFLQQPRAVRKAAKEFLIVDH